MSNISKKDDFYFVHSYSACEISKDTNVSYTSYQNLKLVSSINKKNIYGCQFHPEKSGKAGLKIFKNFLDLWYE